MSFKSMTRTLTQFTFSALLLSACSSSKNSNAVQTVGRPSKNTQSSANQSEQDKDNFAKFAQTTLNSSSASFPKTQDSPPEYIDSLDFVAACKSVGCSVAHTGGHNLHWYVTQAMGDAGRAYYVKGEDQRCWERLDWDGNSIQITYDNCWWTPGYKYSRYADGRWLARIWKPGDSITADHTVFGGNWDNCTDTAIGAGLKRTMTFLWRVKDFDWGPAGRLDTIAIRQSYPHQPFIREHYIYARGFGLIAWNYENDKNPSENNFNAFNLQSDAKPVPIGTKCVQVENVNPEATKSAVPQIPSQQPAVPAPSSVAVTTATTTTSVPTATCTVTSFTAGTIFVKDQPFYSCSKNYSLVFQQDGNLVLYNVTHKKAIWSSTTGMSKADQAIFQSDGNFVVYRTGVALWNSETGGRPGAQLFLQDDGNLVIRLSGTPLWSSMTAGQ